MTDFLTIINGDCRTVLKELAPESVQCCVTSPPYWGLRDYGCAGQIGLEKSLPAYVESMREVFSEVWRVLRDDGTLWLNLGDSYAGSWGNYVAPGSTSAKALDKRRPAARNALRRGWRTKSSRAPGQRRPMFVSRNPGVSCSALLAEFVKRELLQ